jgi:hypothetical protein
MFFIILKMTNRCLQWLQNVQKPLAGLFWHLVWPKIEEDRLPGTSPSNLLSLDRQNAPLSLDRQNAPLSPQPSPDAHICVKTQHRAQPQNGANYRTVRARLAPNRQNPWAYESPCDRTVIQKGAMFKTYGKRFGMCVHVGGYIANIYDRGPGLSPSPDRARISKHCNLNKMQTIYIIRNTCGCVGWAALPKALPLALEVTGLNPTDYQNFKPLSR